MKNFLQNLTGFKKYAVTLLLGAAMALAMPPVSFFPVLLICVPGFIWLAQANPTRFKAFLTGWTFGAGYFIAGFYWISAALFVDIGQWGWVLPLSLIVGPTLMGLYYGFIPLFVQGQRAHDNRYALGFIAFWALMEYARGHLLTGFPWNLTGYAWDYALPILEMTAIIGIYGLTLLTLFWATLPIFMKHQQILAAIIVSFALTAGFGMTRLLQNPATPFDGPSVRIVQANIPQTQKWDEAEEWRNLEKHLKITREKSGGKAPDFILWPETSVTADLALFPDIARYIALSLPDKSIAVLGSLRATEGLDGTRRFFNGVTVLDKQARVLATYDKHHLVPFGEYIPFRGKLNLTPIAQAISGIGDFTPGPGPQTLRVGKRPGFSPLICYEVIFPGAVADPRDRPEWLLNSTNDAWYGRTAGPYQHLAISRVRAIEEGLPLARAANTGISAMIDPLGRILAQKPLGTSGFIDSSLPRPLPPTPYTRFGDSLFFIMFLLFALPLMRRNSL